MREEQDLGVDMVHGWIAVGGDSILGVFLKEATRRLMNFLAKANE